MISGQKLAPIPTCKLKYYATLAAPFELNYRLGNVMSDNKDQKHCDEFQPSEDEFKVLQKVGVHFSREELKILEDMLRNPDTNLSATDANSKGNGSAAYHR